MHALREPSPGGSAREETLGPDQQLTMPGFPTWCSRSAPSCPEPAADRAYSPRARIRVRGFSSSVTTFPWRNTDTVPVDSLTAIAIDSVT